MQIGLLYPYDEKTLLEGKCGVGVDVHSLLDELNTLEIKYGYDLTKVLAELKYNCMVTLGKIEVKQEVKDAGTNRNA